MNNFLGALIRRFVGTSLLFLAVEFVDELVDGYRDATWPAIKVVLNLSYTQIGLLLTVPHLLGCLFELALGVLANRGWRRRLVLLGGLFFSLSLMGIAAAQNFNHLLIALVVFYPASGAFVTLTQTALMDQHPSRTEQMMARWTAAGSLAHISAPLLFLALAGFAAGWRFGFIIIGALSAILTLVILVQPGYFANLKRPDHARPTRRQTITEILGLLKSGRVLKWLLALELSNLLQDILSRFLALYLVAALAFSQVQSASVLFVAAVAALVGHVVVLFLLERVPGHKYLKVSAIVALLVYGAFLLVQSSLAIYMLIALLAVTTAGWHAVLQGNLYKAFPGQASLVMSATAGSGLVAALIPVLLGLIADRWGIAAAMQVLLIAPIAVFLIALSAAAESRESARKNQGR